MKKMIGLVIGTLMVPMAAMATTYPPCPGTKLASQNGCFNQGTQTLCVNAYWTWVSTEVVCTSKQGASSDNCQSQQVTLGAHCGWSQGTCTSNINVVQCQPPQ